MLNVYSNIQISKYYLYPVFRDLVMVFQFTRVKVKLPFVHKAIISSNSKLNIESKDFFYKSCSVWHAIWECLIKRGSLAVI